MSATAPKRTTRAKSTTAKKQEIFFDFDKETKTTLRFAEGDVPDGQRPIMGTIYVRNDIAEKLGITNGVKITLEADNS